MNQPTTDNSEGASVEALWQWVSVPRAATLLHCSQPTVLRRIEDGRPIGLPDGSKLVLESERIGRPQGSRFEVRLPSWLTDPKPEEASAVPDDVSQPDVSETSDVSVEPQVPSPTDLEKMLPVLNLIMAPYVERERERDAQLARRSELIGELQARLSLVTEQHQAALRAKDGELGAQRGALAALNELADELRQMVKLAQQGQGLAEATAALAEVRIGDLTQALFDLGEQERERRAQSWWQRLRVSLGR